MGFAGSIKRLLPVSSRSYHQRTDILDQQLSNLSDKLDSLSEHVARIEKEAAAWEGYRTNHAHDRAVYLVGEPGYPNYGDELIAAEWLKYLAQVRPDVPLFLDCARPGPAASLLYGLHPAVQFVDTIARMSFEFAPAAAEKKDAGGGPQLPHCLRRTSSRRLTMRAMLPGM